MRVHIVLGRMPPRILSGNTLVKIDKGLVGTWREGVLQGRDVWFVTETIY